MYEQGDIVDHKVVKLSHRTRGYQYALVLTFDGGEQRITRLTDTFPTNPDMNFPEESTEFQIKANLAILQATQRLISEGPQPKGKYKTCKDAMQAYVDWHLKNRRNPKIKGYAKKFLEHFGDEKTSCITPDAASQWVEKLIGDGYSYDSVRLYTMSACGMVTWLTEQNMWTGRNPFSNLMKRYQHRFKVDEPVKSYFTVEETEIILNAIRDEKYRDSRIFIEIAYSTGIRPAEILGNKQLGHLGLDASRLDIQNLTWSFLVTKTSGRPFYRTIAIPQRLATFIVNEGITGPLPITEWNVRCQIEELRK